MQMAPNSMLQPQIILLKEGTDTSQGKGQLISNINACQAVVDVVRTTLGPRGMDKLIHDDSGSVTISNDGATLMKLLQIVHPAAVTLVQISMSQDAEVGDGTTSVVLLAGEFLREAKPYIEEGVHPQIIIKAFREASQLAVKRLDELAVHLDEQEPGARRDMLEKSAATSLSSKLVSGHKEFFAKMVVDAVLSLDDKQDINLIGMKKVQGGALQDSLMVEGVAFKKTFSYAGFEQMTKQFTDPKIALLNVELELKAERDNAEVRISDVASYQKVVDAEWDIIYDKLAKIVASGAQIVLSRLAIGDLATQYFADRGLFCAGRVPDDDMKRMARATGAMVQTSCNDLTPAILGNCAAFEERQVGGERFNFFSGCPEAKTCTIVLRGGAEQFIAEAERSLHDAIMNTRRLIKNPSVIAGGGAIEMELSAYLREHSRTIFGKSQLLITAFAKALEVIPRQVSSNAGMDPTDVLNKLRMKHAHGGKWFGVDVVECGICDTMESFVWEACVMKRNALLAASEAACLILSVDETVKNPSSEKPDGANYGKGMGGKGKGALRQMGRGRGRGR
uniref:T-complex protein 1 subunit eta n=1 Tax=Prymnesium polylepis TaxID=72548 RepID=A0A6T7Z7N3_9EUKA